MGHDPPDWKGARCRSWHESPWANRVQRAEDANEHGEDAIEPAMEKVMADDLMQQIAEEDAEAHGRACAP